MPAAPIRSAIRRLEVFLVRPTKYDDDGYLLRHVRGVLPSNTLACLHALTEDVRVRGVLDTVQVRTHLCDESVERVPERRIARAARRHGVRVVVALVGVQTSQFPRAADLALRLRVQGALVLLGGFHVSGTFAMLPEIPADLGRLMDAGVTLVAGEVEDTWEAILRDALAGTLAPRYDSIDAKPDLRHAPVPRLDRHVMRRFAYRHFGTVDAGRGCPFSCSFCTIINVQGRTMRARAATGIARAIAANYRAMGTHHYFFTDDNFARNPHWRAIFLDLIRLREEAGVPVRFLMQVDTLAHRIPDFVALAARAGCFQVFIGMESLNPASLVDGGKRQNRVEDYAALIAAWRHAGVLTHVGYIIGFAHDTPDSVRANLRTLKDEIGVDVASFFMLSPLPGSEDHRRLVEAGTAMDADWSRYDTFHPVVDHPCMSRAEWFALYEEAWRTFYTAAHMQRQLARAPRAHYVTLLQMYLWYGAAALVERYHPMMTGFVRVKPRRDRRAGCVVDGRWRHLRRRVPEVWVMARGYARLLGELRRLWLATAPPHAHAAPVAGAAAAGGAAAPSARSLVGEARLWAAFARAMFGRDPYDGGAAARRDTAAASPAIAHATRQP